MQYFKGKKILVTGGTGLIGVPLVKFLISYGAKVTVVSLDGKERCPKGAKFKKLDLRYFKNCIEATNKQDYVFHLAGVKGSPAMTAKKPASFFYPTISFNTNMMEAARQNKIKKYLFTSSIGVYKPNKTLLESDVWKTFPSENDRFAGWAKRMGELQAEAYKIEYNWKNISIVRPANVYGPFDNFDPRNAMVIPSMISKIENSRDEINLWGDGSTIRDFVFSEDVAKNMLICLKKNINVPINLASGNGITIKKLFRIILKNFPDKKNLKINWDTSKPSGDKIRLMSTKLAKENGLECSTSIDEGIQRTVEWYKKNKKNLKNRYNSFTEKK